MNYLISGSPLTPANFPKIVVKLRDARAAASARSGIWQARGLEPRRGAGDSREMGVLVSDLAGYSGAKGADRWPAIVALVLAVASCLPVIVARYPQMSDYPAHLARYHVMLDGGHSPWLAHWYFFQWAWSGNVGVDLLIRPFAAVFGLEMGGRVITGLIVVLTGLGLMAAEWALRRRISAACLLAFAFIWSPMMLIGMLNFGLGQMVALWTFALWVAMGNCAQALRWRPLVMLPLGLVCWGCHISAWGILGIMVFGFEWSRTRDWRSFLAPWPLTLPILVMALLPTTHGEMSYGPVWYLYKQAIWLKAMRDTWYPLDYLGLVAVVLAIGGGVAFGRMDGRLGWAGLILLIGSIAVPRHISGGEYADYRLITAGLMVCCLAMDWRAPGWVWLLAPALYLARLAVTTLSWQADSAQTAAMLGALDHVPMGARVASAVYVPAENWGLDHFEHIGAYAVIRRDALSNANFVVEHIHMLHVTHDGYVDPSQRLILGAKAPIDLSNFGPATKADYLWYVGNREPSALPSGAVVIWRAPHSLLAKLASAPAR